MSKRRKNKKISRADKVTMGTLCLLGVVGGWNMIGNIEKSAGADNFAAGEIPSPTPKAPQPRPTSWPAIRPLTQMPRLKIEPLPTLSPSNFSQEQSGFVRETGQSPDRSMTLAPPPSAAPLPTLAPLPAMPEYVPPPPPPPSKPSNNGGGGGNGGGGNTSKGS